MKKGQLSKMTREELVNLCRYYKDEAKNPYEGMDDTKAMLWAYEMGWVADVEHHNAGKGGDCLEEYMYDYVNNGLSEFRADDSIPISLKAYLFNRYMRNSYDGNIEPFKKFYTKYY